MHDLVKSVTIAGLLHDIGKVLHRGTKVDGRAHSISGCAWINQFTADQTILDCIRFHHHQELAGAKLSKDSAAYIVYLADNIAAGVDRRKNEGDAPGGFDKKKRLESIYNLLNNAQGKAAHRAAAMSEKINYPLEAREYNPDPASDYNRIIAGINEGLSGISFQEAYINSLLELSEAYLSYVPSSTYLGEVADISLFDHSKITAALAACMALYLESHQRTDYQKELFQNRHDFYREKSFCLFSCDISGIQSFIYTISSKGALKGLRARSFYLEVLLENLADEILGACSLYRTNLLYTGGGHAYIILPNTTEARKQAAEAVQNINRNLLAHFGARLYVAYGLQECSANELMSKTGNPEDYSNIFRSLAAQVAEGKLRRYSAAELRRLNNSRADKTGRECEICGVSSRLVEREKDTYCQTCAAFMDISRLLIKPDTVFVVARQALSGTTTLPLFSSRGEELYFHAAQADEVKALLQKSPAQVVRVYSKNAYRTGFTLATKLWLGDYAAANQDGDLKTFAELAASAKGSERIGVLRADVDDMGAAFVRGFVREHAAEDKYRYLTLSRTATLSRSLSLFFKYYLNDLLADGEGLNLLAPARHRNIVVVYAGGDDLFLVGAWNEVLAAAIDIRRAFARYTGHTLTLSAGFAMFAPGYPIARMAAETAQLEASAKEHQYQGKVKNSISLFGLEIDEGKLQALNKGKPQGANQEIAAWATDGWQLTARHTYDWDTFENQVLGEKYAVIDSVFSGNGDYGNSFLYDIADLLRQAEHDQINIARLAYLLARREPEPKVPEALKRSYRNFAECVYRWALAEDKEDRRQLITAILIYTYFNREQKEEKARHEQ